MYNKIQLFHDAEVKLDHPDIASSVEESPSEVSKLQSETMVSPDDKAVLDVSDVQSDGVPEGGTQQSFNSDPVDPTSPSADVVMASIETAFFKQSEKLAQVAQSYVHVCQQLEHLKAEQSRLKDIQDRVDSLVPSSMPEGDSLVPSSDSMSEQTSELNTLESSVMSDIKPYDNCPSATSDVVKIPVVETDQPNKRSQIDDISDDGVISDSRQTAAESLPTIPCDSLPSSGDGHAETINALRNALVMLQHENEQLRADQSQLSQQLRDVVASDEAFVPADNPQSEESSDSHPPIASDSDAASHVAKEPSAQSDSPRPSASDIVVRIK